MNQRFLAFIIFNLILFIYLFFGIPIDSNVLFFIGFWDKGDIKIMTLKFAFLEIITLFKRQYLV